MTAGRTRGLTITTLGLLWTYLAAVLLQGESVLGVTVRTRYWALILVAGYVSLPGLCRWLEKRVGRGRLADVALGSAAVLFSLLAADFAYQVFENVRQPVPQSDALAQARTSDANVWHGELIPRVYFPTDRDFTLHKPRVRLGAETFGEFYSADMLESPTLVDSVLQRRRVSYEIDEHGFRNSTGLEQARVVALGDSFAFGFATDAPDTWTEVLARAMGQPVYNMGVSSTGPMAQLMSLEHLIATQGDSLRLDHVLWMIFEGNDLENDYVERRPAPQSRPGGRTSILRGTVLDGLATLPRQIKEQSFIDAIRTGRIRFSTESSLGMEEAFEVDGVRLAFPLFHSERWGYRLFNPDDIRRAAQPRSYVENHPHRPLLDETFQSMDSLRRRLGFCVTVVIAPTAARLHGPQFEGFPQLSERAHFAEYVDSLSREIGFGVVNLVEAMAPYAEQELLYYRDDHHWNARGNAVAASLIGSGADFSGC